MTAKNVRDLKRKRQFNLPRISKQHSPRMDIGDTSFHVDVMKSGRRVQKYQTIVEQDFDQNDAANHRYSQHQTIDAPTSSEQQQFMMQQLYAQQQTDQLVAVKPYSDNNSLIYDNVDSVVQDPMITQSSMGAYMKLTDGGAEDNAPTRTDQPTPLSGGDDEPDQCKTYPLEFDDIDEDGDIQINKYTEDDPKQLYSINESPETQPGSKAADGYAGIKLNKLPNLSQASLSSQQQAAPSVGGVPQPMYANDQRVLKILVTKGPMEMSGAVLLDKKRKVLWRNLCMIGRHHIECIVEMSMYRSKFFIAALDLYANQYHVVEIWLQQAQKIVKACDNDLEKVMKMLDFKLGKLYIKHQDILIRYEQYMPEKVTELQREVSIKKFPKSASKLLNESQVKIRAS